MSWGLFTRQLGIRYVALALMLLLEGCYLWTAYPHPAPPTKEEVLRLVEAKVPDETIMNQIDASHAQFFFTTEEIITLRKRGVSERLLNHMIRTEQPDTPVNDARRRRMRVVLSDPAAHGNHFVSRADERQRGEAG